MRNKYIINRKNYKKGKIMKKVILKILISILKIVLNIVYFFMKKSKLKNKVIFISRQSDSSNLDFKMLKEEIRKHDTNIEIQVFCKKIEKGILNKIKYCFYILKVMKNLANSKVCIIDGYSIPVSMLKQRKELVVIQIWHALGAIKKFGHQTLGKSEGRDEEIAEIMDMHKNYTYVLAPSEATKQFYKEAFNVSEEQMLMIGMPRIDYILKDNEQIKNEIYDKYPELKNKKNILYVPTFRIGRKIKMDELIKFLNKDKYNLIIKKHPSEEVELEEGCIIDTKFKSIDWLNVVDSVITDYSACAFESIIKNVPTYFYLYDIEEYEKRRGLNIDLFEEMPSSTDKEAREILKKIDNEKYNFEEMKKFKEKYIEIKEISNTKKIAELIIECIKR